MSPFSKKCGRITVSGDMFGSVLSGASARTSSVIMAYWPGTKALQQFSSFPR